VSATPLVNIFVCEETSVITGTGSSKKVEVIDLSSSTVNCIGFSVLEIVPLQPEKTHPVVGLDVSSIIDPKVYSVVVLPADIIFSDTDPSPRIVTVNGYFLFSKFDVMV